MSGHQNWFDTGFCAFAAGASISHAPAASEHNEIEILVPVIIDSFSLQFAPPERRRLAATV
jgi:hypothetical protein